MRNETIGGDAPSSAAYEGLEAFVRQKVQGFIQEVLEEEVTALLGRRRWQRRRGVDEVPGYRNGYGRLRKLSLTSGTVEVRRPRVRGLEERFESRILPLFKRRTREVGELLPQLYLHGLAEGDFDLALRGLLGEGAPLSASSIARLKAGWLAEYEAFKKRSLLDSEIVYLWVDGVYVKAGLEKEKAALLVAIGGVRDGRKLVLAVEPGYRESKQSWAGMLRGLKERGMNLPVRGRGRRAPGNLGRAGRGVSEGKGAALLEPPDRKRAGQAAEVAAGGRQAAADRDPLRADQGGGRAVEGQVPGLVQREGVRRRRRAHRVRLGTHGHLL